MNNNKVIPNENKIEFDTTGNPIFNTIQTGDHTKEEEALKEVLSNLDEKELSSVFRTMDIQMSYLVPKISVSENTKDLEQLCFYYQACKLVLQELAKKEKNPQIHFLYYTDISYVERILIEHGLLSIQEEAKKKSHRK